MIHLCKIDWCDRNLERVFLYKHLNDRPWKLRKLSYFLYFKFSDKMILLGRVIFFQCMLLAKCGPDIFINFLCLDFFMWISSAKSVGEHFYACRSFGDASIDISARCSFFLRYQSSRKFWIKIGTRKAIQFYNNKLLRNLIFVPVVRVLKYIFVFLRQMHR